MKFWASLCVTAILVAGALSAREPLGDLQSLVQAERSFAAMSVEKGRQQAFLAHLAEDSILFRPGPVSGRKWMQEHPPSAGILSWRPELAFVSRGGDLGFTTGPWEFRQKSMEEKPVAYGSFVSVWRRQADGAWKLLVDTGTSYPEHGPAATDVKTLLNPAPQTAKQPVPESEKQSLVAAEAQLTRQIAERGMPAAYSEWLAEDGWLLRDGGRPFVGRTAVASALKDAAAQSSALVGSGVSAAADLGYTYGTVGEKGNYVRIWRKAVDGKWRLVLDVLTF